MLVKRQGFVLLEVIMAMTLFGVMAVGLIRSLNEIGKWTISIRHDMFVSRVLDNELRRLVTTPNLQEEVDSRNMPELNGEIQWEVSLLEDLENMDGQPITGMYLIKVTAYWQQGNEEVSESAETWRYENLYKS